MSNQPKQDESDVFRSIDKVSSDLQNVLTTIKTHRDKVSQQISVADEQTATINELSTKIQTIETEKTTIASEKEVMENNHQKHLEKLQAEKLAVITEKEDIAADLEKQIQALETEKTTISSNLKELETKHTTQLKEQEMQFHILESEQKELSSDKGMLEADLHQKAKDYDTLMSQFKNISEEYQAIQEKDQETFDVSQLLSLYIALVEDIYAARPHIRILWLLHGDKGVTGMSRQELTKASGFEPIAVLRAIQELAAAGFCRYDEETHQTTLEKRIFK